MERIVKQVKQITPLIGCASPRDIRENKIVQPRLLPNSF
jgi:hypothetical protein